MNSPEPSEYADKDWLLELCQFSLDPHHPYYLSCGNIAHLGKFLTSFGHDRAVIVTDNNVDRHWRQAINSGLNGLPHDVVVLDAGENSKNFAVITLLYQKFLRFEADRHTAVIGIGGGVICDITGFAASTYMRGLPLYLVPSTLLAMMDASIGGKNGIDMPEGKNLIGTFYLPSAVFTDLQMLTTLPRPELSNGLAETLKTAIIGDTELFAELEQLDIDTSLQRPLMASPNLRYHPFFSIVQRAVTVKSRIVVSDFREQDQRRLLNLGHTLGHGLEAAGSFSLLSHGEAVALGLLAAIKIAEKVGILQESLEDRVLSMLTRWNMPTRIPASINWEDTVKAIKRDKKRQGKNLVLVLPNAVGNVEIITGLDESYLREAFESLKA